MKQNLKEDGSDEATLDLKMKEIVQHIIKVSPHILVTHDILDRKLGYFVQKSRHGIGNNPPIPKGFPDFRIGFFMLSANNHGFILLSVSEHPEDEEGVKGNDD